MLIVGLYRELLRYNEHIECLEKELYEARSKNPITTPITKPIPTEDDIYPKDKHGKIIGSAD